MKLILENWNKYLNEAQGNLEEPPGFYAGTSAAQAYPPHAEEGKKSKELAAQAIEYEKKCTAWALDDTNPDLDLYKNAIIGRHKQKREAGDALGPPWGLPKEIKKNCPAQLAPEASDELTKARIRMYRQRQGLPPAEWDLSLVAVTRWREWRRANKLPPHPEDQSKLALARRRMWYAGKGLAPPPEDQSPLSQARRRAFYKKQKKQL